MMDESRKEEISIARIETGDYFYTGNSRKRYYKAWWKHRFGIWGLILNNQGNNKKKKRRYFSNGKIIKKCISVPAGKIIRNERSVWEVIKDIRAEWVLGAKKDETKNQD